MHIGLGNVLDHHRNIVIPNTNRFVVRSRNEPAVFVDKRDGVNRSQMLIIFLGYLSGIHIVLQYMSASE